MKAIAQTAASLSILFRRLDEPPASERAPVVDIRGNIRTAASERVQS